MKPLNSIKKAWRTIQRATPFSDPQAIGGNGFLGIMTGALALVILAPLFPAVSFLGLGAVVIPLVAVTTMGVMGAIESYRSEKMDGQYIQKIDNYKVNGPDASIGRVAAVIKHLQKESTLSTSAKGEQRTAFNQASLQFHINDALDAMKNLEFVNEQGQKVEGITVNANTKVQFRTPC